METDRARAVMLGLACGDALGRPVEFSSSGAIRARHGQVTEMLGNGTYGKPPGTVTDDTDIALCIARSLVKEGAFDGEDIASPFRSWYESGPFDIGLMTVAAIREYTAGTPWRDAGREVWQDRPE